jgi:tRNA A22 N-methylase
VATPLGMDAIWMGLAAARDHKQEWAALLTGLGGPKVIKIVTDAQAVLKNTPSLFLCRWP